MTDWKTTKIKADVKKRAEQDPRTYTEIMEAGLDTNTNTQGHTNGITTEAVEELKNELSMANDPGVEVDVEGVFERLDTLEGRIKDLHTEMKTLQERLER